MAEFKDRLKQAMEAAGLNQSELAKLANVRQSSISDWLKGRYLAKQDKVDALAKALNVSQAWLMGIDDDIPFEKLPDNILPIRRKQVPLLGNIACGEPIYADEDWQGNVAVEDNTKADFCLRAKGDSMIGARIYDGDIVFIRKQPTVENGEIAAVLIGDEATLKRVSYDLEAGILTLYPENPMHKPLRYEGEELETIRILGKAITGQFDID